MGRFACPTWRFGTLTCVVLAAACGGNLPIPAPGFAERELGALPAPLPLQEILVGEGLPTPDFVGTAIRGYDPAPPWRVPDSSDARACTEHLGPAQEVSVTARFEGEAELTEFAWVEMPEAEEPNPEELNPSLSDTHREALAPTHIQYEVVVDRRSFIARIPEGMSRFDEYAQCCREHDCGWGYVSGAYHGEAVLRFVDRTGRVVTQKSMSGWVAVRIETAVARAAPLLSAAGPEGELGSQSESQALPDPAAPNILTAPVEDVTVRGIGEGYVLQEGSLWLSENEFLRRYRDLTGSTLAEPFYGSRSSAWLVWTVIGAVTTAGAIAMAAVALADEDNEAWAAGAAGGLGVVGILNLILGPTTPMLFDGDASVENNRIEESDARVLVEDYRRVRSAQ